MGFKRQLAVYLIIIGVLFACSQVFDLWSSHQIYKKEHKELLKEWPRNRAFFGYHETLIKQRLIKERRLAIIILVISLVMISIGITIKVFQTKKEEEHMEEELFIPKEELKERFSKLSDNELLNIVYSESSDYTNEAIEIAKSILNERGLSKPSNEIFKQAKKRQI